MEAERRAPCVALAARAFPSPPPSPWTSNTPSPAPGPLRRATASAAAARPSQAGGVAPQAVRRAASSAGSSSRALRRQVRRDKAHNARGVTREAQIYVSSHQPLEQEASPRDVSTTHELLPPRHTQTQPPTRRPLEAQTATSVPPTLSPFGTLSAPPPPGAAPTPLPTQLPQNTLLSAESIFSQLRARFITDMRFVDGAPASTDPPALLPNTATVMAGRPAPSTNEARHI